MEVAPTLFYLLAAIILATTILAVSCRQPFHGALSLILSLLGLALLFYLLGAPLLAALEVILYAGAIMMLLLFVIMMMTGKKETEAQRPGIWILPLILCLLSGGSLGVVLSRWPQASAMLPAAMLSPSHFGQALFAEYWLAVELVTLLLFVALVGALFFGGREMTPETPRPAVEEGR